MGLTLAITAEPNVLFSDCFDTKNEKVLTITCFKFDIVHRWIKVKTESTFVQSYSDFRL